MSSAEYSRQWRSENKERNREQARQAYRRKHPEVKRTFRGRRVENGTRLNETTRERNLRKRFDISLREYEEMLTAQQGLCAICRKPETRLDKNGKPVALAVDHNHDTNKIRQLLCADCNTAIGLMGEDILRLESAIRYLVFHKGSF